MKNEAGFDATYAKLKEVKRKFPDDRYVLNEAHWAHLSRKYEFVASLAGSSDPTVAGNAAFQLAMVIKTEIDCNHKFPPALGKSWSRPERQYDVALAMIDVFGEFEAKYIHNLNQTLDYKMKMFKKYYPQVEIYGTPAAFRERVRRSLNRGIESNSEEWEGILTVREMFKQMAEADLDWSL